MQNYYTFWIHKSPGIKLQFTTQSTSLLLSIAAQEFQTYKSALAKSKVIERSIARSKELSADKQVPPAFIAVKSLSVTELASFIPQDILKELNVRSGYVVIHRRQGQLYPAIEFHRENYKLSKSKNVFNLDSLK